MDSLKTIAQFQSRGIKRWSTVIGQGAANGSAVTEEGCRLGVLTTFEFALYGAHAAHELLEYTFRAPSLTDRWD